MGWIFKEGESMKFLDCVLSIFLFILLFPLLVIGFLIDLYNEWRH